jgi:hypothetical protein
MTQGSDEKKRDSERTVNSRWWEQYTVRYFVGAVAGVVAIYGLRQYAVLHETFTKIVPDVKDLGDALLLGSMGLAYCYVASAPILTLHAVRAVAQFEDQKQCEKLSRAIGALLVVSALCIWLVASWLPRPVFAWLVMAFVLVPQLILVFKASRDGFSSTHGFYKKLVSARKLDWQKGEDFVESYRHLREHGNASSILALVIVLGLVAANAGSPEQLVILLLLWMLPSAYCWLIGSVLEARFASGK